MTAFRNPIGVTAAGLLLAILPARGQTAGPQTPPPAPPADARSSPLPGATPVPEKHSGLNFWSLEREFRLGQQMDRQLLANAVLLDDPVVTRYLVEVAQRVAGNSAVRLPVQLRVVASEEPNSFSLPGGFLYITAGMVQETQSEAELAAVLAHEVAHVACRHATKQMSERELLNWVAMAMMFVSGPVGLAVNEAAFFSMPLAQQKLSRRDETEADALGLRYMEATGYDPTAAVSLFERMASRERRRGPRVQRIFLSHPLTTDRLKAINREMNKLPGREDYVLSTSQYEEMAARLNRLGFVPDTRGPLLLRKTKDSDAEP